MDDNKAEGRDTGSTVCESRCLTLLTQVRGKQMLACILLTRSPKLNSLRDLHCIAPSNGSKKLTEQSKVN